MRVVFFASEYSPYNMTGSFRSMKFAKYLRQLGIEVYIITLTKEAADIYLGERRIDASLVDKEEDLFIYRALTKKVFSDYFGLFPLLKNNKLFFEDLKQTISKISPQVILATYPHSSAIKIASRIGKELNLPIVIDMRDPWSHWPVRPYKNFLYYYLTKRAERKIFQQASKVLVVTPQMIDIFRNTHGEWMKNKTEVIFNTFDTDKPIAKVIRSLSFREKSKIKIGYVGSFYFDPGIRNDMFSKWYKRRGVKKFSYYSAKEDWKYRSPYYFLKAIKLVIDANPGFGDKLVIEFVGEPQYWLKPMIEDFGLGKNCLLTGFLRKDELSHKYEEFDFVLSTSEKVFNGEHYCLPSKLFDYVKIGKPVIAFLTNGIQKAFIEQSNIGFVFDPDDIDGAAKKLEDLLLTSRELLVNHDYLDGFTSKASALKLRDVLIGAQ